MVKGMVLTRVLDEAGGIRKREAANLKCNRKSEM